MRGFAQTAHCPRCGTAKPMGAEVVPIVTCVTCGLGFDPKPREQQPTRELAPIATGSGLVHVEASETEVLLSARDSVWSGVFHLLVVVVMLWFAIAMRADLSVAYLAALAILGTWSLYAGASRLVNKIYVHATAGAISGWERPLPRHRARVLIGELRTIDVVPKPTRRTFDVVVDGVPLVNVPHEELANELVLAIREHRARLGAAVRELED